MAEKYDFRDHSWVMVGDGANNGYNEQGCCVLSVPAAPITITRRPRASSACMAADELLYDQAL
jgi:hypothetical protein